MKLSIGFYPQHRAPYGNPRRPHTASIAWLIAACLAVISSAPAAAWVGTTSTTRTETPLVALQQSPWGQLATASALAQANKPMEALQPLMNATDADPKNVLAHYLMADVASQLGRQQSDAALKVYWQTIATDYYEKTICLNPGVLSATLKLGKLAMESNDYSTAEQHYLNALRMLPDNAALHYNLANVYDEQQRTEEAIQHYEKTVALDPTFIYAYNNLGLLYELSEQPELAQKAFQSALAKEPRYNYARLNLGQLHAKLGHIKTAEALFNEALRYEPNNAWAYVYLGNIHVQQHQYQAAATAYKASIERQPDYTPTYYLMAAVLEKLGRWNESAALGAQYLEKAPNGVYAAQAKHLVAYAQTQAQVAHMPNTIVPGNTTESDDGVIHGYVQAP